MIENNDAAIERVVGMFQRAAGRLRCPDATIVRDYYPVLLSAKLIESMVAMNTPNRGQWHEKLLTHRKWLEEIKETLSLQALVNTRLSALDPMLFNPDDAPTLMRFETTIAEVLEVYPKPKPKPTSGPPPANWHEAASWIATVATLGLASRW